MPLYARWWRGQSALREGAALKTVSFEATGRRVERPVLVAVTLQNTAVEISQTAQKTFTFKTEPPAVMTRLFASPALV